MTERLTLSLLDTVLGQARNPSLLSGVLGTGLPGLGTEHPQSKPSGLGSVHPDWEHV